jgi:AbrB family looped-hinge helix DNA binding protein
MSMTAVLTRQRDSRQFQEYGETLPLKLAPGQERSPSDTRKSMAFAGCEKLVVFRQIRAALGRESKPCWVSWLTYQCAIDIIATYRKYIEGGFMGTITISPKFQVVIPKAIREELGLLPGQKVQAIAYGERIELIPIRPIKEMRGFLKGIDTAVDRESDRS